MVRAGHVRQRSRVRIPLRAVQLFSLKLAVCLECFHLLCLALLCLHVHHVYALSRQDLYPNKGTKHGHVHFQSHDKYSDICDRQCKGIHAKSQGSNLSKKNCCHGWDTTM